MNIREQNILVTVGLIIDLNRVRKNFTIKSGKDENELRIFYGSDETLKINLMVEQDKKNLREIITKNLRSRIKNENKLLSKYEENC